MPRLRLTEVGRLAPQPLLPREELAPGILHLGAGAFFRAHTAYLTELAMLASGARDWGIIAVTQRSNAVAQQLAPQDFLFTVNEREPDLDGAGGTPPRLVSSVLDVIDGRRRPAEVVAAVASPSIRVVTLTITEKGYRFDQARRLDQQDAGIAADLRLDPHEAQPETAIGQLAFGLLRRFALDGHPLTVMSCDNLPSNGRLLAGLIREFLKLMAAAPGEAFWSWYETNVAFPSTMVDRMVPATSAETLDEIERDLGVRDEAAVTAERFWQWVIEDDFAGPVPDWVGIGATSTSDVEAWENAKLRLLNAAHSMLAYLGSHAGHATIAEAASDPTLVAATTRFLREEALPTLDLPDGLDGTVYCDDILRRFTNPALGHTTAKVGADGSQKLAVRITPTLEAAVSAGLEPELSCLALAAWAKHVATSSDGALDDPLAQELQQACSQSGSPESVVRALFAGGRFFTSPALGDPAVLSRITQWYELLGSPDSSELQTRISA